VDLDESESSHRTAVAAGVSPELDELKRQYHGLEHLLDEVAKRLVLEVPEWARIYVTHCVFYPQLGFLTVVTLNPTTRRSNYEGEGMDDEWNQMFVTEGNIYYKNGRMKEMDHDVGDLYCMISGKHEIDTVVEDD